MGQLVLAEVPAEGLCDGPGFRSTGHWTLPPDVTLADYPLVDVSIEPYDGDRGHSTNSAVRGALDLGPSVAALDD